MKKTSLFLAFAVVTTFCFSQNFPSSKTISVISSQGGFNKTNSISLEWTLGESFVKTLYLKKGIITQGFHQSFINDASTLSLDIIPKSEIKSVLFPNPVNNELHIKLGLNVDSNLNIKLYDITGNFILKSLKNIRNPDFMINLEDLSSGIYILQISDENESFKKVYQIIKD